MTAAAVRARVAKVRSQIGGPSDVLLAARIALWAVVLRGLKFALPLPLLVRAMRLRSRGAARSAWREQQVATLSRWACRLTSWSGGGNCLERALVSYRYLCRLGAEPSVVVGFRHGAEGTVHGHAWV